jgi:hypothetical protein
VQVVQWIYGLLLELSMPPYQPLNQKNMRAMMEMMEMMVTQRHGGALVNACFRGTNSAKTHSTHYHFSSSKNMRNKLSDISTVIMNYLFSSFLKCLCNHYTRKSPTTNTTTPTLNAHSVIFSVDLLE